MPGPLRAPLAAAAASLALLSGRPALGIEALDLRRAHEATLRLDVAESRSILAGLSADDPAVATELALLLIYEGDCDGAGEVLRRRGLGGQPGLSSLAELARGCARVTAATTVVRDDERGVELRLKDDDDLPLVPFLLEVTSQALTAVEHDLGVALPRPLHIVVVRDQYGLAAMTGLPEEAAQTTGTVAIAKWGRVTMLSPRAAPHGYPWADTLMHELTHLAVTRASRDRAPLWLQEGVAKRQETRWRAPSPYDDLPPPEAIARLGFERGLALPLDKLGPSIAMLPTPEQAMVAFAEVHSFLRFWTHEAGPDALSRLLFGLADAPDEDGVNATLIKVSGTDLPGWNERWQRSLSTVSSSLPPDLMPSLPVPRGAKGKPAEPPSRAETAATHELFQKARLGELLLERGHAEQALPYLQKTSLGAPHDPSARARLALALRSLGQNEAADKLVESPESVHGAQALFFAMRGASLRDHGDTAGAEAAFRSAAWLSPYELEVACQAGGEKSSPTDPDWASLCERARRR